MLVVVINGHSYVLDHDLTADDCYNAGRVVIKQWPADYMEVECVVQGDDA